MATPTLHESVRMLPQNVRSPDVANTEFGVNHGLANKRQERQQMRQRGAASRKIESVDFGISFPSSARSLRSTTRTPRLRRSTSRQASKTPVRRSPEPSLARSPTRRNENIGTETPFDVGAQPSKRRRLSQATQTPQQDLDTSLLSLRFTRSSLRRKLGSKVFPIAEDEGALDPVQLEHPESTSTLGQQAHSPLFVPETRSDKENNTPQDLVSAKDYTLLVDSIGSPSNIPTLDAGVSLSDHADSAHDSLDVVLTGEEHADTEISQQRTANIEEAEHTGAEPEELAEQGRRETSENAQDVAEDHSEQDSKETGVVRRHGRKKRKSELLTRRKKRTSGQDDSVLRRDRTSSRASERALSSERPRSSPVQQIAPRAPNEVEGKTPARDRERSPKETDEEGDETYIQGSSPDPETPAIRKKGPQVSRRQKAPAEERPRSKNKKIKPTFPILTHRLTNVSSLPTIHEDDEDGGQSHDERDAAASLKDDRPQPNAVDVLAQICRETIGNMMERLSQTDRSSERAALKNKRSALEAFGHDLDDELFEMSEAVENRMDLEARVRKSKREKSALQAEWMEIRKERERIALKCDAVRRRHWIDEEEARQKWQLSEAVRRAELAMDRADGVEDEGTEFLLRSVAQDISSASEQGGLLERIQSFNTHLENMALFLERRAT